MIRLEYIGHVQRWAVMRGEEIVKSYRTWAAAQRLMNRLMDEDTR